MCRFPTGPVQEGLQQCSSAPSVWKIPLQSKEAVQGNSTYRSIFHQTCHTRHNNGFHYKGICHSSELTCIIHGSFFLVFFFQGNLRQQL